MRLEDEDKTVVELLQDAVEQLRADMSMMQIKVDNLEYMLHEMNQHINHVEQEIT